MKTQDTTYEKFATNPNRIDGAIHNTVTVREGVGFNYTDGYELGVVEFSFSAENSQARSIMVADITAAIALRDKLNQILSFTAL